MNRITFIGGGNMARSLIGGLIGNGHSADNINVADPDDSLRDALADEFGVATFADNLEAIAEADTVVMAVKPNILPKLCKQIGDRVAETRPLLISIAAGIRMDQIARWLGTEPALVRCMPNTPALIGAGATGMVANSKVSEEQKKQAEMILESSGVAAWIPDEALIDTVTGISGSAPAYFFLMVEALEAAGVKHGLPRETARQLAAQTCMGAGRMMVESGESPEQLRKRVTSPGGTTQAALDSLNDDGLAAIAARAVDAARRRGAELADDND